MKILHTIKTFAFKPLQRFGVSAQIQSTALWSMTESFSAPISAILLLPILTNNLGLEGYGVYVVILAIVGLFGFSALGINTAIAHHISIEHKKTNESYEINKDISKQVATAVVIVFSGIMTMIALLEIIRYIYAYFLTIDAVLINKWNKYWYLVLLILLTSQFDSVLTGTLKGVQEFKLAAKCEILMRFAMFIICSLTAYNSMNVSYVLFSIVLGYVFGSCIKIIYLRKLKFISLIKLKYTKKYAKEYIDFGKWMTLQNLSGAVFASADKLILGAFHGASTVGVYNILINFAQLIHFVTTSTATFIAPKISSLVLDINKIRKKFKITIILTMMQIVIFATVLVFITDIVYSYFKINNNKIDYLLLILSYAILAINIPSYFFSIGFGEIKKLSIINTFSGIVGLIACVLLIPLHAIMGAACAKIVYAMVVCLTFYIPYKKFT